jgi:hypothetical protein
MGDGVTEMRSTAVCLMVVLTCSCHEVVDNPKPNAAEKGGSKLLGVESFSLTKENLRLNYRVTNVFPHDIWVCTSISNYATDPNSSAETLIRDGTLQVKRRAHLEQRANVTAALFYAVYHRLPPGASRSETVLLPLPVRSDSPAVYTGLPVSPVVLKQVVFELGYFVQDLRTLLPEEDRSKPYRVYRSGYFSPPDTAFIPYIIPRRWDKLDLEKSVQIVIPDVNVPGMIAEKVGG